MSKVEIHEVGPRDGFQNLKAYIEPGMKKKIIDGLIKAGVDHIQITSFVNPKAIPQMKDAREITEYCVNTYPAVDLYALVPNLRGAQSAYAVGLRRISVVVSMSESHNRANIKRSRKESLEEIKQIKETFLDLDICVDIATAFGCPFEGKPKKEDLENFIAKLWDIGIREFCLCDTIGAANPKEVREQIEITKCKFNQGQFMVHIHDTRGMGLACTLAAIEAGVNRVQTTLGGL